MASSGKDKDSRMHYIYIHFWSVQTKWESDLGNLTS